MAIRTLVRNPTANQSTSSMRRIGAQLYRRGVGGSSAAHELQRPWLSAESPALSVAVDDCAQIDKLNVWVLHHRKRPPHIALPEVGFSERENQALLSGELL